MRRQLIDSTSSNVAPKWRLGDSAAHERKRRTRGSFCCAYFQSGVRRKRRRRLSKMSWVERTHGHVISHPDGRRKACWETETKAGQINPTLVRHHFHATLFVQQNRKLLSAPWQKGRKQIKTKHKNSTHHVSSPASEWAAINGWSVCRGRVDGWLFQRKITGKGKKRKEETALIIISIFFFLGGWGRKKHVQIDMLVEKSCAFWLYSISELLYGNKRVMHLEPF